MLRQRKSRVESTLEFFRSGDAGEAKVVFELARGIMRERFPVTKVAKKARSKKAAPVVAQPTQEVTQ